MHCSDRSDSERSSGRSRRDADGCPTPIEESEARGVVCGRLDGWYERARRRWPRVRWSREAYARHVGSEAPSHPVDLYLGGAAGYRVAGAWETIEQELGPAARRILARHPRADWTCEDLWAETRVRLIEEQANGRRVAGGRRAARIIGYRGRVDLVQYLVTIGRRLAVERQRRRGRQVPLEAAGRRCERLDPRALSPDEYAGDVEASGRIKAALHRRWVELDAEVQFLIVMVYLHGMRQKEAGALLGWSPFKTSRVMKQGIGQLGEAARLAEARDDRSDAAPGSVVSRALCEQFGQLARGVPSMWSVRVDPGVYVRAPAGRRAG